MRNNAFAAEIARAIHDWQHHALVDNRVHLRYELSDETAPAVLSTLLHAGHAQLLSFMDHSPGQGQFRDVEAYRNYLTKTYQTDERTIDEILEHKAQSAKGALTRMQTLAAQARSHCIAIASHDDDSPAKVATIKDLGAVISEFQLISRQRRRHAHTASLPCSVRRISCVANLSRATCGRWTR